MSGFVRTVLGDVAPEELGPTYAHEHLLTRPAGEQVRDDTDLVLDDEQRAVVDGFVRDLTVGMDYTDVRAGVVKAGSSLDRVTDTEARVIRAAAAAQRETGAPI